MGRVQLVFQTHQREALIEQARPQRQPMAISGRRRHGRFGRGLASRSPRLRQSILWSFEVKQLINRSNVRECFFQAVSNSSWANFGYLVAAEVGGQDTLKELRMLFAAHGIGFIKLEADNPADSQVLIPARERDEIDWGMVNRLTMENKDFLTYVKLVKQFYQTGEARSIDWDITAVKD